MDKKASLGIGTLVIFIAILIAVAVVAYTIMQTHSTLSARSYESFTESKKSMVTKILPEKLVGESISPHSVQEFVLTVTSAPGSKPVEMNDSILVITSMGKQVSLTYGVTNAKRTILMASTQ